MKSEKKKIITVDGRRIEVTAEVYKEYQRGQRKERYIMKDLKKGTIKIEGEKIINKPSREDSMERLIDTHACVKRNYQEYATGLTRQTSGNIPLLKIPAAEPQIRDANDWYARFETVRNTFSSRVGQISNAALDRSVIAYNENSDSALRQRCKDETEILAILTGLEIDSAKSGVKPDLSEYLNKKVVNRSLFLQYKKLLDSVETRGKWYEPTFQQKRKAFFEKTDWSKVDSNLERLPYLAYQLKRNTPKLKPKLAKDSELFAFARERDWKESLDPQILSCEILIQ